MISQENIQNRIAPSLGFTLVEMAVVLVIVGLMLGGLILPLTAQMDQKNYGETKKQLEEAKEALYGYVMSHHAADGKPYLPCPGTGTGMEQSRTLLGECQSQEGLLPWITLGLPRSDSWGNLLRYRVHPYFSNANTGFTLSSTADFNICQDSACATVISSAIPAVLISHGKNGYGAYNAETGNAIPVPAGLSANELININMGESDTTVSTFVGSTYDDIVVWVSPNILFNRMIAAEKLP